MKSFKNSILVICILFTVYAQAQKADSVKHNSAKDLIELENNKNLISTTKDNPPVVLQTPKATDEKAVKSKWQRVNTKKKKRN